MTTSTGNLTPLDDRAGFGFDTLIAPAGPMEPRPLPESEKREPTRSVGIVMTSIVVTMTVLAVVIVALVLAASPGQAAGASSGTSASSTRVGDVTASEIVELVESQWTDAGAAGTATCPEPAAQAPGTTVECSAEYDGAVIGFTATLGDVDAGEERVSVTSWVSGLTA